MTKEEYIILYEKVMSGQCTPEEKALFDEYYDDFSLDIQYWDESKLGSEKEITQSIFKKLNKSIRKIQNRKTNYSWYMAAAILFSVISIGIYLYIGQQNYETTEQQGLSAIDKDRLLNGEEVLLSLSDGSQITLSDSDNGVLANQDNVLIKKDSERKIIYDASDAVYGNNVKYNTIVIPKRKEYQLHLPDGSKVWINAESVLKFPVAFTGEKREVELSGEAYFEVAKDKTKPFIVKINDVRVEVLGTQFNVNAYSSSVKTTLVEGSVRLKNKESEVILKPGQSGSDAKGKFIINNADIEEIIAWKEGYFIFRDESIKNIMEKISRWYDIRVEYQNGVENREFYGKVSKYEDVAELLKNMELTGIVKFKIEPEDNSGKGRRVIVMP